LRRLEGHHQDVQRPDGHLQGRSDFGVIVRDLVLAKIGVVFPGQDPARVLAELDGYEGPEGDRVRLAILKLCQESGLTSPESVLATARVDYRDVLAWAEYPGQMAPDWFTLGAEEQRAVVRADLDQYERWLAEPGS
jgi:hypothetical protein